MRLTTIGRRIDAVVSELQRLRESEMMARAALESAIAGARSLESSSNGARREVALMKLDEYRVEAAQLQARIDERERLYQTLTHNGRPRSVLSIAWRLRHEPQTGNDQATAHDRARLALELLSWLTPARIRDEDVGDALETLAMMERAGAPRWQVLVKVISTFLWVGVNCLREVMSAALGKARPR